jgi:hypothetical protein
MHQETGALVDPVIGAGGRIAELFTADYSYVTEPLARFYGLSLPPIAPGLVMVRIPNRGGVLSQGSFLAAHPSGELGIPWERGLVLVSMLRCQQVPDPPQGFPPRGMAAPQTTARQRVAQIAGNPSCATCHSLFFPLGLGLEQFDGAGQFRLTDGGNAIDTSIKDYPELGSFPDTLELARKVMATPAGQSCFAQQFIEYSMGQLNGESCVFGEVAAAFLAAGGTLPSLLEALPRSELFTRRTSATSP